MAELLKEFDMAERTCKLDGCDRTDVHGVTGWCHPHHRRVQRTGRPGRPIISPQKAPECSVAKCTQPGNCSGLCKNHWYRQRSNGDPLVTRHPGSPVGPDHPARKVDAGYDAIHHRTRRARGVASAYQCSHCDRQAQEWALIHEAAEVRVDPKLGLAMSDDPADYFPLCVPCHRRYDLGTDALLDRWKAATS